jgi:putative FmdB family regulatory protein
MPVYEYRCTSCHQQFEYEHRMSEKRTACEKCQGALERLISRTSFAFKGGGWYKDLYATPRPGAASAEDGGSSSSSAKAANDGGGNSSSRDSGSSTSSAGSSGAGASSGSGGGGAATSGVAAAS